jgi:hypothetical protein
MSSEYLEPLNTADGDDRFIKETSRHNIAYRAF